MLYAAHQERVLGSSPGCCCVQLLQMVPAGSPGEEARDEQQAQLDANTR